MNEIYPTTSFPAERFAPPDAPRQDAIDLRAGLPLDVRRLLVLCPQPLVSFMDFTALHGILAAARSLARGAEIDLFLRCPLPDPSPLKALPADRLSVLPAGRSLRDHLQTAVLLARCHPTMCLLIGATRGWRWLVRTAVPGRPTIEIPFRARPWVARPQPDAVRRFHDAAASASPRWLSEPGLRSSTSLPSNVLVHQGRFHIGDTLWLTPLLRGLRRLSPESHVVVATTPACAAVLEGNPHISETLILDDLRRSPPTAALRGRRFDGAIFAFGRADTSRWLAEAAHASNVPVRINLEFLGHGLDPPARSDPFTHEGWFFWGAMRHPRVLMHALLPLHSDAARFLDDLRPDYVIPADAERRAAEIAVEAAGHPRVILAPSAIASERWPPEHFGALAARLVERYDVVVMLAAGPSDTGLLGQVQKAAVAHLDVVLRPRIRLIQERLPVFAALLREARLLVANDAAPIHFADAFGVPTLYFSRQHYVPHSHPARESAWALFDEAQNRVANITVEQAVGAVDEMVRRAVAALPARRR